MTNFDLFTKEKDFAPFAEAAVAAERIFQIDPAACVMNCRRSMEGAVKWMYSVDSALVTPWDDKLVSLMNTEEFRQLVDENLLRRMEYIRRTGNSAAHSGNRISKDQAALCLENLFYLFDFVASYYCENYSSKDFDKSFINAISDAVIVDKEQLEKNPFSLNLSMFGEKDLQTLLQENAALREELTARRAEQQLSYIPKPLDLSEFKTRRLYIDTLLADAGWIEGTNWINEYEIPGMPNKSEVGFADYALLGNDGMVLAIVEAKRSCVDVAKGRQQAKLYADLIEQKQGRRPVVFLTNGFDTRIIDNQYPERKVAAFYSKRDLEKWFNLLRMRSSLKNIAVDKNIAGRYYQESAVKAVCDSFGQKNRRKALLVMATGSGKTRTVIALVKVLLEQGWIKNVLFLADRNSLVTQAKRNFVNLLPDLSVTNLCEEKDNFTAHGVFSTYQTMMNCIDELRDEDGKLFSCGHFDLVICDEYEIIGLNLKSQLNQGFRGLVLFLLTLKIADKAIHRRQYAQNRNLSAERGAASLCSASTRHTLPTYISFRRSTELSARVDLHRLPLRHSTHVPVARAA